MHHLIGNNFYLDRIMKNNEEKWRKNEEAGCVRWVTDDYEHTDTEWLKQN